MSTWRWRSRLPAGWRRGGEGEAGKQGYQKPSHHPASCGAAIMPTVPRVRRTPALEPLPGLRACHGQAGRLRALLVLLTHEGALMAKGRVSVIEMQRVDC